MQLTALTSRLDERLDTAAYADIDASANGLQVGPDADGGHSVQRAAFAVDAAQATFDAAIERDADLLVTHHGMVWGGLDRVTGTVYDRVARLVENDLALYVSHLPLDGHPELGNAARIARSLGIQETEPFGAYGGEFIGRRGRLPEPLSLGELARRLDETLPEADHSIRQFDFGPEAIERVGICTGSGADWLNEAADRGLDALITGEGKQQLYHDAREAGVSVLLGGHYRTEIGGVRALETLVAEWGPDTTFIDHPTGL